MDERSLKFAILRYLGKPGAWHENIGNLIGTQFQAGNLERSLNVTFDIDMRGRVSRSVNSLLQNGLVRSTYMDMVKPEDWIQISDAGKAALNSHALDELDELLMEVAPGLVELRDGAWRALTIRAEDSIRQAAHSARELISQVLRTLAPDPVGKTDGLSNTSGAIRKARV